MRIMLTPMLLFTFMSIGRAHAQTAMASPRFEVSAEDCIDRDYSSRFGPIRNQGDLGMCHAFAAAALGEEEFCLQNSRNCGRYLSPYDIASCSWNSGGPGQTYEDLQCLLDVGTCLEKNAPYDTTAKCEGILGWLSFESQSCLAQRAKEFFLKHKQSSDFDLQELRASREFLALESPQRRALGLDLMKALNRSSNSNLFVHAVLVPPSCSANRNRPQRQRKVRFMMPTGRYTLSRVGNGFVDHFEPGTRSREAFDEIRSNLARGRSTAIGFNVAMVKNSEKASWKRLVGDRLGHAAVVTGMRYNRGLRRCELNIRNSWGPSQDINGWKDVDDIIHAIVQLSSLE